MAPPEWIEPGESPDEDDVEAHGRPDGPRTWVHPSELAMQSRADLDRSRRRRVPALVFIGVGAAVLAAGVAMGWGWVPSPDERVAGAPPQPDVVPLVLVSDSGTATRSGVVVGDDGLIVTRSGGLDSDVEVWVLATGREPLRARVAGTDPSLGVAVLDAPVDVGRPSESTATPTVGDAVVVYTASGAEQAPLRWSASVADTDVEERLADGTTRRQLILLRPGGGARSTGAGTPADAGATSPGVGATGRDGVVYDDRGRFVGIVVSERTGSGDLVVARSRALEPTVESIGDRTSGDEPTDPTTRLAATTEPGG